MLISPHIAPVFRNCLACLLLAGASLLWPAMSIHAQNEPEAPAEEIDQQAESEQAEAVPQEAEDPEPLPVDVDKTPGRFIPSEEISEDLSVPFPVDI